MLALIILKSWWFMIGSVWGANSTPRNTSCLVLCLGGQLVNNNTFTEVKQCFVLCSDWSMAPQLRSCLIFWLLAWRFFLIIIISNAILNVHEGLARIFKAIKAHAHYVPELELQGMSQKPLLPTKRKECRKWLLCEHTHTKTWQQPFPSMYDTELNFAVTSNTDVLHMSKLYAQAQVHTHTHNCMEVHTCLITGSLLHSISRKRSS